MLSLRYGAVSFLLLSLLLAVAPPPASAGLWGKIGGAIGGAITGGGKGAKKGWKEGGKHHGFKDGFKSGKKAGHGKRRHWDKGHWKKKHDYDKHGKAWKDYPKKHRKKHRKHHKEHGSDGHDYSGRSTDGSGGHGGGEGSSNPSASGGPGRSVGAASAGGGMSLVLPGDRDGSAEETGDAQSGRDGAQPASRYGINVPDVGAGRPVDAYATGGPPLIASAKGFPHPAVNPAVVNGYGGGSSGRLNANLGDSPLASAAAPASLAGAQAAAGGGVPAAPVQGPIDPATLEPNAEKAIASRRAAAAKIKEEDFTGALADAERAITLDSGNFGGYLLKSQALNRLNRYEEAEAAAKEAIYRAPANSSAYRALGWSQLNQKKFGDALANLTQSISINPKSAKSLVARALVYEQLGDKDKMMADLRSAVALNPAYRDLVERAEAGERLFDPDDKDNWRLLDSGGAPYQPPPADPRRVFGLVLMALAGLGIVVVLIRARKSGRAAPAAGPGLSVKGSLLAGKYEMIRVIGKGGMGEVWEATDKSLGRTVAVKRLDLTAVGAAQGRQLFLKEAQTSAQVHHPSIVDIFEVIDDPTGVYLVFELLTGKTVEQLLMERERLSLAEVKGILNSVAAALECAHGQGVVHRDLKPSNIMITEQRYVKVMDFGISRRIGQASPNTAGDGRGTAKSGPATAHTETVAGTPGYMAPETLQGAVSAAADVYSLGVCLYEMTVGELPFRSVPGGERQYVPASLRLPGLPAQFDEVVGKAVDPDPAKRFAGVKELAAQFLSIPETAP